MLLAEGIERIGPFAPECQRVDVVALIRDATALREDLLRLGPDRMKERDLAAALTVRLRD